MNQPARLLVHHSASSLHTTIADVRRWHVEERGYADIGYHWVIHQDGSIHRGRPTWVVGAHDLGENTNTLGVCGVGDNTTTTDRWTMAQRIALVELMVSCRVVYGSEFGFARHSDDEPPETPTECPGLSEGEWSEILGLVGS